jgi:hypothetical protein
LISGTVSPADNELIAGSRFIRENDSNDSCKITDDYVAFDHIIAKVHEETLIKYPCLTTGLHRVRTRDKRDGLVLVCYRDIASKLKSPICSFRVTAAHVSKCKLYCFTYIVIFLI